MKKIALLMLVFTLFAVTNVYAQKLKNGTYEGSASGYGNTYVKVTISGRKIKDISVYYADEVSIEQQDGWMSGLINGNAIDNNGFFRDKHGNIFRDWQANPRHADPKQRQEYEDNSALVKKEGPHYNSVQEFANAIVTNQSTVIDVMSGATRTCEGIIEAVHNALRSKNGDIVRAWEQEGKQKRLATAQRREKLKEEERQRVAKAEAEKKRQEEESKQKVEDDRQKRIAEVLAQEPVTPDASEFKYDVASDGGVKIIRYLGNAMSIRIPEKIEGVTVTEIESGYYGRGDLPVSAFYGTPLVKVVVPNTLVRMSFRGCSELREVILEDGRKYIPEGAFSGCGNLKSIKLPRGLQGIGYEAFQNSGLESIDIPDSVTRIDNAAFRDCKNLKSVKLPEGLKELEGELERGIFEGSGLESIIIPDSVTEIGEYTFSGCTNLKSIVLPKNLKIIERLAFRGCSALSEIIIPDTLKGISFWGGVREQFRGCTSLSLATKSKLRELGYDGEF